MAKKIKKIPEDHPFYHDTWKLLKNYRDVAWNLELSNLDLQAEFRAEFGSSDHKSVDILTSAGSEITNPRLESFERSLQRSRKMMNLLDSAIQLMRSHHKKGELYYWILYYTYLSPQEYTNYREILHALEVHFPPMSRRTYYSYREEAISTLSNVLWGYTSRECAEIMEKLHLQSDAGDAPFNSTNVFLS